MRFVYLLEDDLRFQKEIVEAIQGTDPKIQVRIFPKLENFVAWIKQMMLEGPAAIAKGGQLPEGAPVEAISETEQHQLVCVISKVEYLGKRQLPLLKKTRQALIQRGICTAEDPTAFVLTCFEDVSHQSNIRDLEDPVVSNVLFKPFDRLILTQHLTFAIDGRHPPSKYTIANQKTATVIEMLKDVQIESLGEMGFVTRSDRAFPVGALSKYYSPWFQTERIRSVHAVLEACVPHPKFAGEFQLSFAFFGQDPTQVSKLRRTVRDKKLKSAAVDWTKVRPAGDSDQKLRVAIVDDPNLYGKSILESLSRRFSNVEIMIFGSYFDFLLEVDPKLAEQGKKVAKPFSAAGTFDVEFDLSGKIVRGFPGNPPGHTVLFDRKIEAVVSDSAYWGKMLGASLPDWVTAVTTGKAGTAFAAGQGEEPFYFKLNSSQKSANGILVQLAELTADERMAFLSRNSRFTQKVDLIFISHKHLQSKPEELWPILLDKIKDMGRAQQRARLVVVAGRDFTDAEKRTLAPFCSDILFLPVDRGLIIQKAKFWFPQLKLASDPLEYPTVELNEIIKTAGPVAISEISEAGLILSYNRNLPLGTFREFMLWQPYEVGAPELAANCNFVEEKGKGEFQIHFVFFGVTDHFLKAVRLWIRENYVLQKEKG